jgi:hypothetical protein
MGTTGNASATLSQNNPNPYSSETKISMNPPDHVVSANLMVYSLDGKQLKSISIPDRGDVSVRISGNELTAGMYLYALVVNGVVVDTKRMILTRE